MRLAELLARGEVDRYVEAFGRDVMATLDRKLRDLETKLADTHSQKLPPKCWRRP